MERANRNVSCMGTVAAGAAVLLLALAPDTAFAQPRPAPQDLAGRADLVIRGGWVLDGRGTAARQANIVVRDGRIAVVGEAAGVRADWVIDAAGRYVLPGFIDLHSHAEAGLDDPHLAAAANLLIQGITTVVVGQDGQHPWPIGSDLTEQADRWRRHGPGVNVVPVVGYWSLRRELLGWSRDVPGPEELEALAARLAEHLDEGAWGVSTGLEFTPYVTEDEVVRMARVVADRGGFYTSHIRSYYEEVIPAIEELIRVARETGVRAVATHLKVNGPDNWGVAPELVGRIAAAREAGLSVYADHTPYDTGAIDISLFPQSELLDEEERRAHLPPGTIPTDSLLAWAFRVSPGIGRVYTRDFLRSAPEERTRALAEGRLLGRLVPESVLRDRLRGALGDPERREALESAATSAIARWGGAGLIRIVGHPEAVLVGMTLAEAAAARARPPALVALELTLEGATFVPRQNDDRDLRTIVQRDFVAASSDGWIPEYGHGTGHPRWYGAFVRRVRRYVYDLGWIDLPFAVRAATGLAAEIVGLEDRGRLRPGQWADIVILDPRRLRDRATYAHPHRHSEGIEWVLVNGEVAVERGATTGRRAGRVLLHRSDPAGGP